MANPFVIDTGAGYDPNALSGLGQALGMLRQERQAQARKEEAMLAEEQRRQAIGQAFQSNDPDQVALTAAQYPEMADLLFERLGAKDDQAKTEATTFTREVLTSPSSTVPALYERRIQELRNQGRDSTDTEQSYRDYLQNPESELNGLRVLYAGLDQEGYKALTEDPQAAIDKAARDERSLDIRQAELDLKQRAEDRMATKLSAPAEKALIEAQDTVVEAQRDANEFDRLATEFDAINAGGVALSLEEGVRRILGTQDAETEFRRRFNKVRLSEGLKNLPPGPATDRDVQEAFKGVPPENAGPEQVASFLRGAAKLARFQAGYNQFKADAISSTGNVRNLNKQWRSKVMSDALGREVTVAEIYAEAQLEGMSPEDVATELGVEWDY